MLNNLEHLNTLITHNFDIVVLTTVFIAALTAAFSHCIFMCGAFVNMMVIKNLEEQKSNDLLTKIKAGGLLPYHLGRTITYTLIALILFYFKELGARLINIPAGYFMILAGFLMLYFAITGHLKFNFITNFTNKLIAKPLEWVKKTNSTFLLGLVLGFLPCGLVYGFIALTLAVDSAYKVILIMIIFGIATTVPLVLYGIFGQSLINRLQNKVKHIKLIVLTLSSIWLIYMGVNMLMMMNMAQAVHKCH